MEIRGLRDCLPRPRYTIQTAERLFIVDRRFGGWVSNAVYTAVSRSQFRDQIVRVLPHEDDKGPVVPTALQATPNRALIAARLKQYVVGARQKGRPKYTGISLPLSMCWR